MKLEKQIETEILHYLNSIGAFPMCIEISGRPIKNKHGIQLIPFKSPFHRKGMSDILCLYKGKLFAFEVKTRKELTWTQNKLAKYSTIDLVMGNKKDNHLAEQDRFIQHINDNGGHGAFVCSVDQVKEIIANSNP